jgi:hypothetical protein
MGLRVLADNSFDIIMLVWELIWEKLFRKKPFAISARKLSIICCTTQHRFAARKIFATADIAGNPRRTYHAAS